MQFDQLLLTSCTPLKKSPEIHHTIINGSLAFSTQSSADLDIPVSYNIAPLQKPNTPWHILTTLNTTGEAKIKSQAKKKKKQTMQWFLAKFYSLERYIYMLSMFFLCYPHFPILQHQKYLQGALIFNSIETLQCLHLAL